MLPTDEISPRSPLVANSVVQAWLKPIRPFFDDAVSTFDKPLAELTIPEIMSWVMVFAYAIGTGMIAGRIAGNLAATALRGPVRLR